MKYVSITFDDGRSDNFTTAFPIMRKYGLTGTLFCTTGFVDGTWQKDDDFLSADKPLTVENMREMKAAGWEIALHGDKHKTELEDLNTAAAKLSDWGLGNAPFGFSLPRSVADEAVIREIMSTGNISYIRRARARDTRKLSSKILFGLYTYLGLDFAYNLFNRPNLNLLPSENKSSISSVVIRNEDKTKHITKFVESADDNTWIVFMFHSILDENHRLYGADPWNWSSKRFEALCAFLERLEAQGIIKNVNMCDAEREKYAVKNGVR